MAEKSNFVRLPCTYIRC